MAASAAQAASKTMTCRGAFGTGSGMAGSYVGDTCRLAADSEAERVVQQACKQGSVCSVSAVVIVQPGGRFLIERVLEAREVVAAPAEERSYLKEVGQHLDGILAPSSRGCDEPADTAVDRVSVLLDGLGKPAIQIYAKLCAVVSGDGDPPGEGEWQAVLRARCDALGVTDDELRAGAGRKAVIVVDSRRDEVRINGEALQRCPIRKAYTPLWWITNNYTFRGKYPAR